MARRPSTASTSSHVSLNARVEPGYFDAPLSNINARAHLPSLRTSSSTLAKYQDDDRRVNPDDLFTQRTVAEVKAFQQQLRNDADAKQEELRLMVGERYRDLLQASTSIISIAQSSKRVIEALEETKDTIISQEGPPLPKRASLVSKEDGHLQTLQLLSAHIKLLLDAPEHLWRLIERKKYFQAAWLFLLARVAHRALVRDDDQDEEDWGNQGIDVMEQFPLVQRQWDAVSHFRTQIIHKATLSLRSYTASSEDTCAILITLHLLDSRPLAETLSVLLTQRTKTLHTLLSKSRQMPDTIAVGGARNDVISPKRRIREVKRSTEMALDAISRTITASRDIFAVNPISDHSLITSLLLYMQSEEPEHVNATSILPRELLLTTQTLLTALPSSTHLLHLPANLRSYKPYVDLSSSSSSVPPNRIVLQLNEWLRQASMKLQGALSTWLSDLQSVQSVWGVRTWIRGWIATKSKLQEAEQEHLNEMVDKASRQRIAFIWKVALAEAGRLFQEKISSSVSRGQAGSESRTKDESTVEQLFAPSPLPAVSRMGTGSSPINSTFQKYKSSLQRQMCGRTAMLDEIIGPLESHAESLQQDFSRIASHDDASSRPLAEELREAYQPDADALCLEVIEALESASKELISQPGAMGSLTFIGRLADELSSSSQFLSSVGCGQAVAAAFRERATVLHSLTIHKWRTQTVSMACHEYWAAWHTPHVKSDMAIPSYPSASLMQSLISLSKSIQGMGFSRDMPRLGYTAGGTLNHFVIELLKSSKDRSGEWKVNRKQVSWDLLLLELLGGLWNDGWTDTLKLLGVSMASLQQYSHEDTMTLKSSVREFFSRSQLLLAPLLPLSDAASSPSGKEQREKFSTLLAFGIPAAEVQFQPALELAKPSSRFGLLLVGNNKA
ncbi:hypothetical protein FIBSPDRAFT_1041536 [Athelia psychrophila]|uniref:Conserved oligomeric Golgi complex subunit 1 n=1 Tax=Athelia psychrophila TaxID=1759441 RepID=A0A166NUG8_9AGAM|nr:hypothetical protein FIBSPDRAFT_1041536 [Fibularhizoctonia sp. CBS 109695]